MEMFYYKFVSKENLNSHKLLNLFDHVMVVSIIVLRNKFLVYQSVECVYFAQLRVKQSNQKNSFSFQPKMSKQVKLRMQTMRFGSLHSFAYSQFHSNVYLHHAVDEFCRELLFAL